MQIITPIINKISSARVTPAGNAVLLVVDPNGEFRTSITLRNEDATYNVWVKAQLANSTAPTTTTVKDTPYILKPGEARTFMFGRALDVYAMNSNAGAGTVNLYVEENQGGVAGEEGGEAVTAVISGTLDTELPAAEVPADDLTNATAAPRVNALAYVFDGTTWDRLRGNSVVGAQVGHNKTIKFVTGTVSADTDIVAAVASKRIKVVAVSLTMVSATVVTVTMQSNASTALATYILQSTGAVTNGIACAIACPSFLFATVAGEKLTLDVSAAVNVTYNVAYWDDDAV